MIEIFILGYKLIEAIFNWLNHTEGVAAWVTATVAIIALVYTIKDFFWKQRPFINFEVSTAPNSDKDRGGWSFFAGFENTGTYTGVVIVETKHIMIGDEIYPGEQAPKIFVSPGLSKKYVELGSIWNSGIKKIREKGYKNNTVEIYVKAKSAKFGSSNFKYLSEITLGVDVTEEKPIIRVIKEKFT